MQVLVRPYCTQSPFAGDTVTFSAFFQKPCSEVRISEPGSGWVINKGDQNTDEKIDLKVQGYVLDPEVRYLDSLLFEYRQKGFNEWHTFEAATRDTLAYFHNRYKSIYREPTYPIIWDITGQSSIPDGNYDIRIKSECGTKGYTLSNVVSGVVDRNGFLQGNLQPTSPVNTAAKDARPFLTTNQTTVDLVINGFQLDSTIAQLDSIVVQARRAPAGGWSTFAVRTDDELRSDLASSTFDIPTWTPTWAPNQFNKVVNGDYDLRAVAYADGYSNSSGNLGVHVDISSPVYLGSSVEDTALYIDSRLELSWSEQLASHSFNRNTVGIYQVLEGANPVLVDTSYFDLVVNGDKSIISFSRFLFTNFDMEKILITVDSVTDVYGNYSALPVVLEYRVVNEFISGGQQLGNSNLRGLYHTSGVVELNWTNSSDFQFEHIPLRDLLMEKLMK